MKYLFIFTLFFYSSILYANVPNKDKALIILEEYQNLRSYVETLEPDEVYAQLYKVKYIEDYEIVWNFTEKLGRNEFIRIYRRKSDAGVKPEYYFAITYQRSSQIFPSHLALRRSWGYWPYEFRYDSVDVKTKNYLGKQGINDYSLDSRDREILAFYGIELFFD